MVYAEESGILCHTKMTGIYDVKFIENATAVDFINFKNCKRKKYTRLLL